MKRRRPTPRLVKDEEPPTSDGPALVSIFLSARQQADLHLPPFDVEGEAVPEPTDTDARSD